jgi:sodium/proline symporter
MALKSKDDVPKARFIGMTWMVFALLGAIFTGFAGIAYFAGTPLGNSETVFMLGQDLALHLDRSLYCHYSGSV